MKIEVVSMQGKGRFVFTLDYEALKAEAEAPHNEQSLQTGAVGKVMDIVFNLEHKRGVVLLNSVQYARLLSLFEAAGLEQFFLPWER